MDINSFTLYKIVNRVSGKTYIGQTTRDVSVRWNEHRTDKRTKSGITAAIQKYGKENFSFSIEGQYETLEQLNDAEEYFIDFYNCLSPHGYNLHSGGLNHKPSEESRKRQAEAQLGKKKGKYEISEETHVKMSLLHKNLSRDLQTGRFV